MNKTKSLEELKLMERHYPKAEYYLDFRNKFELLVGTILSAQCTDERVNKVLKELRKKYHKPEDILKTPIPEFENDIKSTGFYKNKAKNIRGCCELIVREYRGQIPKSMEKLLKFPGISRKTANVILQNGFNIIEGVIVDTHVLRVSYRLGWSTKEKDDKKTEKELMELFDKEYWTSIPHLLKSHGKALCKAPVPYCSQCFLNNICPKKGVIKKK